MSFAVADPSVSEVAYAQSQSPFSQSYNPNWKNNPNLSYKNPSPLNSGQNQAQGYKQPSNGSIASYPSSAAGYNNQNIQFVQNSEMKEFVMKQQAMMNGLQETIKKQSETFLSTIQQLAARLPSAPIQDARLPSQTEANPKGQCGSISAVDAVTTRSGLTTSPILANPLVPLYVTPALRTAPVRVSVSPQPMQEKEKGKDHEPQ
jgi:hypothetical protein